MPVTDLLITLVLYMEHRMRLYNLKIFSFKWLIKNAVNFYIKLKVLFFTIISKIIWLFNNMCYSYKPWNPINL